MTTFDELRAKRKPREKHVDVPLDEDLLQRIDALERAIPRQKRREETDNVPSRSAKMERDLEGLRAEASEAAETFTFRELPRPVYRDLIAEYPSDEPGLRWDEESFAPALIAATCASHDYTVEQWRQLWNEWASWVVYPLFATAFEVCESPSRVPFGVRSSEATSGLGPNSGTADLEG